MRTAAVDEANFHLSRVEQIKRFTPLDNSGTPAARGLTPTRKPRRRAIAEKYVEAIDAMYIQPPQGGDPR